MPKKARYTKEKLRELAIKAGHKLIARDGLSKFSVVKVSREIKYANSALYKFFKNANELILHINAMTIDEMKNYIETHLKDKKLEGPEAIKQLAKLYTDFARKNLNNWRAVFDYELPKGVKLPKWYEDKVVNLFSLIENPLEGFSDKKNILRHAEILWASIHGICLLSLTKKLRWMNSYSLESNTDLLVERYLGHSMKQ